MSETASANRLLRTSPALILAIIQVVGWFLVPLALPEQGMFGFLAAVLAGMGIILWWILLSRATWLDRIGVLVLMVVAVMATSKWIHISIAGAGMGRMFYILAPASGAFGLAVGAVMAKRLGAGPRRAVVALSLLAGCGMWTVIRTNGIGGSGADFAWRWSPTAEDRLLAIKDEPKPLSPPAIASSPAVEPAASETRKDTRVASVAEWPGFRGPGRDGTVHGVQIKTDWSVAPPKLIWRRPIGPGWSSFAVQGDLIYTQEQRGDDEVVAAYSRKTGEPVWRHRDHVRFYESNGGAGPRGTPTLNNGKVYTFGATGILNVLDAATGTLVWSKNVATDTSTETPGWGFTSSPLVLDDMVIVAAAGTLAAYDVETGKQKWVGPAHGGSSYSSPQRVVFDGVQQIVLLDGEGAAGLEPSTGKLLWQHSWPGGSIVQPAVTANGDLVINSISMMGGVATRRIAVTHVSGGWSAQERWTSNGLKPYYNDFVIHKGHAFGFDGSILACIDLEDGKRKWKGGRYGNGQLVLLSDQDLLLVLSEEGEIALVKATPDEFSEIARIPALEGKTWNHPVLVGDTLLIRNGEEMAAFKLSLSSK